MKDKGKHVLKKNYVEIINLTIGAMGIMATIISAFKTEAQNWVYIYAIILSCQTILTFLSICGFKIKYNAERDNYELRENIEILEQEIKEYEIRLERESQRYFPKNREKRECFYTILSNLKNASKLNNELCNRIPELSEKTYRILKLISKGDLQYSEEIKGELQNTYDDLENGLFDLYKRYTSNLLTYLVKIYNSYIRLVDKNHTVAITTKLFDQPLYGKNDIDKIKVYTAFRDRETYEKKEREIGEELYTISGNADFVRCLVKEQFVINNAKKDSESYFNEHRDFDAYYNCAIVVPLRIKQEDNTYKIWGYLCCDCLNDNIDEEVFDNESASLLFSVAQMYATFLDTLETNWRERTSENKNCISFSQVLFKKTYRPKNEQFKTK